VLDIKVANRVLRDAHKLAFFQHKARITTLRWVHRLLDRTQAPVTVDLIVSLYHRLQIPRPDDADVQELLAEHQAEGQAPVVPDDRRLSGPEPALAPLSVATPDTAVPPSMPRCQGQPAMASVSAPQHDPPPVLSSFQVSQQAPWAAPPPPATAHQGEAGAGIDHWATFLQQPNPWAAPPPSAAAHQGNMDNSMYDWAAFFAQDSIAAQETAGYDCTMSNL
jgi:hypothetical protein